MDKKIVKLKILFVLLAGLFLLIGCGGPRATDDIVQIMEVQDSTEVAGIKEIDKDLINRLRETSKEKTLGPDLQDISGETSKYSVEEYLIRFQGASPFAETEYRVGGGDILNIIVYDEPDLTRNGMRIANDGTISFPLLGRLQIDNLTISQIEELIARKLAEKQLLLDAQVSVLVDQYGSKKYKVLGEVRRPGSYSLKADEHLIDAISNAGGVNPDTAGKEVVVVRTVKVQKKNARKDPATGENKTVSGWGRTPDFGSTRPEESRSVKVVISVDLEKLLRGNDLVSNMTLQNNDVIYLPEAEFFYIMGEVKKPGSYKFTQEDLTLVGAIGTAGGFTNIAARKKTRIIRVENGVEKIITVNVDAITSAGRKIQDVRIKPDDIIIVPQSFF
ncbi:MAG: hypothetical protein AMK70_05020 [Nitrospira bacterium SG8_35_1]|nr:MAG: hypothetical protein AMK70_05020 [Nitrospira bacterium SG8_35_1]